MSRLGRGLKSAAQTKFDLRYHFVWVPKYRKRVLVGNLAKSIEGMIRFAVQIYGWQIFELSVNTDHVHLYCGAPPKWSPSKMMNLIKGGTSKKIKELYPELEEVYWGATFWADGYLVKSAGEMTDKVISAYIANQRKER